MVRICFKHPSQQLFFETAVAQLKPNWIVLVIQLEECLRVQIQLKQAGLEMPTRSAQLDAGHRPEGTVRLDAY